MIDGRRLHLSAGGLYDGLVLLVDDETGTYWDHVTGVGLHGPLAGAAMPTWYTPITTVRRARQTLPELQVFDSRPTGTKARLFSLFTPFAVRGRVALPPLFRKTMGEADVRLPEETHGLGVVVGRTARFYPLAALASPLLDRFAGQTLRVETGPDAIPFAAWEDGRRPMQIFMRWYGFSASYPGCEIGGAPTTYAP